MTSENSVLKLAEENLEFVLKRAKEKEGRIDSVDAVAAQLFCRVVEAETNGGAYGTTTYIGSDRRRVLAAAAGAVPPPNGETD